MTRPMTLRLLLGLIAALALAPSAFAAGSSTIIADCEDDGRLQGKYSNSDLRKARRDMPADVAEYSNCLDVLRRAEVSVGGGSDDGAGGGAPVSGGGGGSVGGAASSGTPLTADTPQEKQALEEAVKGGGAPIRVGEEDIVPGQSGIAPSGGRSELPGTLVAALIALGVLGGALGAVALRRRFSGPDPLGA